MLISRYRSLGAISCVAVILAVFSCNTPDGVLVQPSGPGGMGGGGGSSVSSGSSSSSGGDGGAGGAGGGAGQLPKQLWAKVFAGNMDNVPISLALDADDSSIMTAQCGSTLDFGGDMMTTPGDPDADICVAKVDRDGNYKWMLSAGTAKPEYPIGAVPFGSDIVLHGTVYDSMSLGGLTVDTGEAYYNMFVALLSDSGAVKWVRPLGLDNAADEDPRGLAVLGSSTIVIAGNFGTYQSGPTLTFGGQTHTAKGYEDIWIAAFDNAGALKWSSSYGVTDLYQEVYDTTSDGINRIYIAGAAEGAVDFGGGPLGNVNKTDDDIFIAALDEAGIHQWSKSFGNASYQHAERVRVDKTGNVYIAGELGSDCTMFDGKQLCGLAVQDLFLTKMDSTGAVVWASKISSDSANTYLGDIAIDTDGSVFMTGFYMGSLDFGGGITLPGPAEGECPFVCSDAFLAQFDANGKCVLARRYGSDKATDRGLNLAFTSDRDLMLFGFAHKGFDLGAGALPAPIPDTGYMFLAKLLTH